MKLIVRIKILENEKYTKEITESYQLCEAFNHFNIVASVI
jgi:hypothetical protein